MHDLKLLIKLRKPRKLNSPELQLGMYSLLFDFNEYLDVNLHTPEFFILLINMIDLIHVSLNIVIMK